MPWEAAMSLEFKRILCPVDLSGYSLEALKLAVKVAEASGATLDVLHVIHNPFDEIYMTAMTQTDPALIDAYADEPQRRAKIMRVTEERSEVLLKQFCHEAVKHYPQVRYHIRKGDPFEAILDGTEDFLTDLLVLATHGRTGIKRLVIGNVAEKVVRHAPCPVLTVKPNKTN
jgi:nucleotide-binding universal stress UspA family protein